MFKKVKTSSEGEESRLEVLKKKTREAGASAGYYGLDDAFEKEMNTGLEELARKRFGDPGNLDALKKELGRLEEEKKRIGTEREKPPAPPREKTRWSWKAALSILLCSALLGLGLEYFSSFRLHWQGWTLLSLVSAVLILHTDTLPSWFFRSVSRITGRTRKTLLGWRHRRIESRMARFSKRADQMTYKRERIGSWVSGNRDGLLSVYARYKDMGERAR